MRVYLDYNATAPPSAAARAAMHDALEAGLANPSSVHAEGSRTRDALADARDHVASSVRADPGMVVFTSGGSEADALALHGCLETDGIDGLVIGELEHPAVLDTARHLQSSRGLPLRFAVADERGVVTAEAVEAAMRGLSRPLVSVMLAHNEYGTLNPVGDIAARVRAHGGLMHTDAVQALGKVPVDIAELGADLISISSHKMGGPAGAGALIVADLSRRLQPYCPGGGQESGRRCGTESWLTCIGFGAAAAQVDERRGSMAAVRALRDRAEQALLGAIAPCAVIGHRAPRLPNTTALAIDGIVGAQVVRLSDERGLAVSAGAACHGSEGSHGTALERMGYDPQAGLVRISLGPDTTDEQVQFAVQVLGDVVADLRAQGG